MIIRVLTRLFDLILLNILWLICSLPVFTVGASTTALYKVTLQMTANEEGYILRDFLKAFKKNFKQSTIVWLVLMGVGAVLGVDFLVLREMEGTAAWMSRIVWIITATCYVIEILFVFPLIARFENTTVNMIKNAVLIPVSRLPYTFCVFIMTGMCLVITFFNQMTIMAGAIIWSILGMAVLSFANSFFMRKILEPYV